MPKNSPSPLPEPLRYLRPFARALAKLPSSDLNEGVDPSRLEAALRKRIRGLDEDAAGAELARDRALLETWLKADASPDHPAYWILGYLMSPDIGTNLVRPPEPPPRGPEMSFDAPDGWKVKAVPFRLDLKKGKLVGSIAAIDSFSFETMQWQKEQLSLILDAGSTLDALDLCRDCVVGKKYVYRRAVPAPWKRVDYLLSVPGGFVYAFLDARGADFDELPFETKLPSLRLSGSI